MNYLPSPETFNLSLGIANFTLEIKCNHAVLAQKLIARYKHYPPGGTISLTAHIDWEGRERQSSLLDTSTSFRDGTLCFSAPGYQGYIDEKAGKSHLQLSSSQPVEEIDYFLRIAMALLVHQAGGILMHSAGILRNGKAYLFFGHSGSGKTTVCRVSEQDTSTQYQILNDDLILLIPKGRNWYAYSTPFWNPTQVKPANLSAPASKMYLLVQDKCVYTQKLTAGTAIAALLSNIPVIPQDPVRSTQLLDSLTQLISSVPVYELHFLPDNSFWDIIPG